MNNTIEPYNKKTIIKVKNGAKDEFYDLDVTGWKLPNYKELGDGSLERTITDLQGQKYTHIIISGNHFVTKHTQQKNTGNGKTSPEKELYEFVEEMEIEFCTDQFANECAIYMNKYYELNGKELKALIAQNYFETYDKVFNDNTWNKFINIVSNKCVLNTKYFPLRIHTEDDTIYYDTGKTIWKFYSGEPKEYNRNDPECKIIFRQYAHQIEAPLKSTPKTAKEIIEQIVDLFNINDFRPETIPILFCSNHPNPMTLISGDPGSAKSTFSMFIKKLVDPDQVDKLTMPDTKSIANFGMHRQQFYLLLYDNVRMIAHEQSDELCRMITGGTSISRKLYTNGDLYISKGLPRILVNGLRPEPSSFNDLLDRTLLFDMYRIANSVPEKLIWKKIDDLLPELRYACIRDVSKALTLAYEQEFPKLPRMSEYCLIAESLNVVWKGQLGDFVNWFNNKMTIAHVSGMDDSFAVVLLRYLEFKQNDLTRDCITKSASEWRFALESWAKEKDDDFKPIRPDMELYVADKDFPKNATWIGRRFRDVAPLLDTQDYVVTVERTSTENKITVRVK